MFPVKDAIDFVKERINSLQDDVQYCLETRPGKSGAPFPALLYCFSTIDLLGALYNGDGEGAHTTQNSKLYVKNFMKYSDEQIDLLQNLFRHKIVHLAQPPIVIKRGSKLISWSYNHKPDVNHLKIIEFQPPPLKIRLRFSKEIECTHQFFVSIWQFEEDIRKSVENPNDGYLAQLQREPDLQEKFMTAINQIYDPNN